VGRALDPPVTDEAEALIRQVHQVRLNPVFLIELHADRSGKHSAEAPHAYMWHEIAGQFSRATLMLRYRRWGHVELPIDHLVAVAILRGVPDVVGFEANVRAHCHGRSLLPPL